MGKRRKIGQKQTPLARASIIKFLEKMEFASQEEIGLHLAKDDSLPLSKAERKRVGFSTLRMPAFISFTTKNGGETLWKNNPEYVDWRKEYASRCEV